MNKIFSFIHICLVMLLAYVSASTLYKTFLPAQFFTKEFLTVQEVDLQNQNSSLPGKIEDVVKVDPDKIIHRNLFNTALESSIENKTNPSSQTLDDLNLEPTKLELSLWGTVTGNDILLAVIEDKQSRNQALYMEDDEIQGAVIKKILRHGVILSLNGEDQLLEMEEESKSFNMFKERSISNQLVFTKPLLERPLDDSIMKAKTIHLKLRPYFMEDKILGLMLYGINPSSDFRNLGFKNGDVVIAFDQKEVSGLEDVDQVVSELTKEGITNIKFLRGGQENQVTYTKENGKYRLDFRDTGQ